MPHVVALRISKKRVRYLAIEDGMMGYGDEVDAEASKAMHYRGRISLVLNGLRRSPECAIKRIHHAYIALIALE